MQELRAEISTPDKLACRVCGKLQGDLPWGEDGKTPTFDVCYCCGVQFGYEDCDVESLRKFRQAWLEQGANWFVPKEKPKNWVLEEQMKNIPESYR
ncbi:MAG: hypothetical protein JSR80_08035 [Verrucomicrobia bacterium]|nr:hypothetical protein [Verrucomicrobiota bacterium]